MSATTPAAISREHLKRLADKLGMAAANLTPANPVEWIDSRAWRGGDTVVRVATEGLPSTVHPAIAAQVVKMGPDAFPAKVRLGIVWLPREEGSGFRYGQRVVAAIYNARTGEPIIVAEVTL